MRTTYITAAIIAVLLILWLLSGQFSGEERTPVPANLAAQNAKLDAESEDKQPTRVRARVVYAQPHTQNIVLRGRTENKRTVSVRAETGGRVEERPVERGDEVRKGQLLCRLAMDDRKAGLYEAKEALNQAEIEYKGALKLKAKGFQSETAIAQAKARLAAARAQVERRSLEIDRTQVRAPFDGVVENVALEVGDFVSPGSACATIVDLDPMLLIGQVAEVDVPMVKAGRPATGRLMNGLDVQGLVTFIGQQSDPQTRTYPVEIQVDNADHSLRSGITAEIHLPLREILAHQISPALLALDDEGSIGVRLLDAENRVEFHHVEILDDDGQGVWLSGLPERATIITVGQELVVPGELVEVEFEAGPEMPARAPEQEPAIPPLPSESESEAGLRQIAAEPIHIAASP